jgi:hypothetical protein
VESSCAKVLHHRFCVESVVEEILNLHSCKEAVDYSVA